MRSNKVVIGLVDTYAQAEQVVAELQGAGFASSEISVLLPDKQGTRDFAHEKNTKAPEGSAVGATAGGVIGGTLGLLAGIGSLAIPGLGPLIAAGPIMATLSGGAAGAALGAVSGALVGMGIPEIEAKQYESKVKGGNILISVHVEDSDERASAKQVFEQCGATDVVTTGEKSVSSKAEAAPAAR
jgi:hypothetical protein